MLYYFGHDLPVDLATSYRPAIVSTVFDTHGEAIGQFSIRGVMWFLANVFPPSLAAEDARFFSHRGVDLVAILRAFFSNLTIAAARARGNSDQSTS
jgi:membrane carboxypeptidase/penicillin-binding protein